MNTPDDLAGRPGPHRPPRHARRATSRRWRFVLAVATVGGTFEPLPDLAEGTRIKAGQVLGHIVTRQGNAEVTAHDSGHAGRVAGPPRRPGQLRANPSPASEETVT